MLQYNQVEDIAMEVCEVYSIHMNADKLEIWVKGSIKRLNKLGVTIQELENAIDMVFIQSKKSNFEKLPTPVDIARVLGRLPKTVEEMAQAEMTRAFSETTGLKVRFEHPVTNYVVQNCCGGLETFIQEYLCRYKDDKKAVSFKKKEFIQDWITAYENENYSTDNLSCTGYIPEYEKVNLVTSTQKIEPQMLLTQEKPVEETKLLLDSIAKNMRS